MKMNILKNSKIKTKWIVLISLAIITAVVITVFFSQWTVRNILTEENEQTSSNNAKNAVDQVSLSLETYEKTFCNSVKLSKRFYKKMKWIIYISMKLPAL